MSIAEQGPAWPADTGLVARAGLCAALAGAAVVPATVVGEHYAVWPLAGLFFVGLMVVEGLLAVAVVISWRPLVAAAVVASSVGTLAVWGVSRTAGLPFGPVGFRTAEVVGVPDLACVVLETATILLALPWLLPSRRVRDRRTRGRMSFTLAGAIVLLATSVTAWGVAPALTGSDERVHHHDHAE